MVAASVLLCTLPEHFCAQGTAGDRAASVLDAHAQRLGLAAADSQTAVHPLEGVLASLTYQDWQLQAPEPQLPQVLPGPVLPPTFVTPLRL